MRLSRLYGDRGGAHSPVDDPGPGTGIETPVVTTGSGLGLGVPTGSLHTGVTGLRLLCRFDVGRTGRNPGLPLGCGEGTPILVPVPSATFHALLPYILS